MHVSWNVNRTCRIVHTCKYRCLQIHQLWYLMSMDILSCPQFQRKSVTELWSKHTWITGNLAANQISVVRRFTFLCLNPKLSNWIFFFTNNSSRWRHWIKHFYWISKITWRLCIFSSCPRFFFPITFFMINKTYIYLSLKHNCMKLMKNHPFSQRHIPLFVIVEIGQNETIYIWVSIIKKYESLIHQKCSATLCTIFLN